MGRSAVTLAGDCLGAPALSRKHRCTNACSRALVATMGYSRASFVKFTRHAQARAQRGGILAAGATRCSRPSGHRRTRISTASSWVNIDGTKKAVILAQVGHFYFGAVGQ